MKARLLKKALFDRDEFGIRYTETATRTAAETLHDRHDQRCSGNRRSGKHEPGFKNAT